MGYEGHTIFHPDPEEQDATLTEPSVKLLAGHGRSAAA